MLRKVCIVMIQNVFCPDNFIFLYKLFNLHYALEKMQNCNLLKIRHITPFNKLLKNNYIVDLYEFIKC